MAVPRNAIPHLRLVFGGTTGSAAQEIWACTLKLIPVITGTPPVAPTQSQAAASVAALSRSDIFAAATGGVLTAVTQLWATLGGSSFHLHYLKLNAYGENDMQVTDPTVDIAIADTQGSIPCSTPWSTALDFYHRSADASRGFATHGRIGFPTGLAVDLSTGKIDSLGAPASSPNKTLAQASTAYVDFLAAVAAGSPGSGWYPGILYTSTNSAKPPQCRIITRIVTSDIPGEVRTRENALTQGSAPVAVVYS